MVSRPKNKIQGGGGVFYQKKILGVIGKIEIIGGGRGGDKLTSWGGGVKKKGGMSLKQAQEVA